MRAYTAILIILIASHVATSLSSNDDCFVGYNLSVIPQAQLHINQLYNGGLMQYTWVMNLCQAVSAPPSGVPACASPAFISEYSAEACETGWNTYTGGSPSDNEVVMRFGQSASSNHAQWTATVTLTCGGSSPALVPIGNVLVTGPSSDELNFAFAFTTTAVCNTPSPPTPPTPAPCVYGGFDLSDIPTAELAINQVYNGAVSPYAWVVNLCRAVNIAPAGTPSCAEAGYISEYSSQACETTWDTFAASSLEDNTLTLQYAQTNSNHPGWTASVTLHCGETTALVSTSNVAVTGDPATGLNFNFNFNTSAVCASSKQPPILPQYFQGQFTEYTAYDDTAGPPYVNGVPPAPLLASRGRVYYDWRLRNMIEVRYDYCVNIFPTAGHDFPCTFQNVNGTSYLITYNRSAVLPPCCVFAKPWFPPQPAFLRDNVTAVFFSEAPWNAGKANWFKVPSIQPPTGPFFYSFNASIPSTEEQVYSSFAFPGISGWVQQSFFDISATPPDASVWELPGICLPVETLPSCDFFGSSSDSGDA